MMIMKPHIVVGIYIFLFTLCQARIHKLRIENDTRPYIPLTSYGYLPGGYLNISLRNFVLHSNVTNDFFGLTFEKGYRYFSDENTSCSFEKAKTNDMPAKGNRNEQPIILFRFNLKNRTVEISRSADTSAANVLIFRNIIPLLDENGKDIRNFTTEGLNYTKSKVELPLTVENGSYGMQFALVIANSDGKGLYSLGYYSCANYDRENHVGTSFVVDIVQHNNGSYLSANDISLSHLYSMMSIMSAIFAIFWILTLHKNQYPEIHYLMYSLVILKTLALLLSGINYNYISESGGPTETWPTLYYARKVLVYTMLLNMTILIAGVWTYLKKHLLPIKERQIWVFMCVIPFLMFFNFVVPEITTNGEWEEEVENGVNWADSYLYIHFLGVLPFSLLSMMYLLCLSVVDKRLKSFALKWMVLAVFCVIYFRSIAAGAIIAGAGTSQSTWLFVAALQTSSLTFFMLAGSLTIVEKVEPNELRFFPYPAPVLLGRLNTLLFSVLLQPLVYLEFRDELYLQRNLGLLVGTAEVYFYCQCFLQSSINFLNSRNVTDVGNCYDTIN